MNLFDFTRAMWDAYRRSVRVESRDVRDIVESYDEDFERVQQQISTLLRQHGGIREIAPGDSPTQRINSLRLGTAYPGIRRQVLEKLMLDNQSKVAELAGPLLSAVIKCEFAEAELRLEEKRTNRVKRAMSQHRRNGIYDDVAIAADRIHALFGVTFNHWKALDDSQLESIAAIILTDKSTANSDCSYDR